MSNGTALLVLDAQVSLFAPGASVYQSEKILETLGSLIQRARRAGATVVYIQNNGGKGEPDQLGSVGWHIHPAIAARAGELVLQKSTPDAFHRTPLQKELAKSAVRRLVVAGLQTESSVDSTVRRASSLGYQVVLVKDGHSTYGDGMLAAELVSSHNASLSSFATVVESDKVDFMPEPTRRR